MKSQLNRLSGIFILSALLFTACKKTSSTPADPQLTPTEVAGQVATSIDQGLIGGVGGLDLSGGINSTSTFSVHKTGKTIYDLSNPTCNTSVDTTLAATSITVGDSTVTIGGSFKFGFACTNGLLSSFTTVDNLTIGYKSPSLDLSFTEGENLTVDAIDPTNSSSNISVNGTLSSNGNYQYLTGTKGTGTLVFNYTLKAIVIAGDGSGTIVSGSATFTTTGSGPRGVWDYQGTITFSGGATAAVVINGKTYTVNLQTGASS